MMVMMKTLFLGVVIVLAAGPALAKDFPVFGPGASSCKEVLDESKRMGNPEGKLDAVFHAWILGYLSGLNRPEFTVMEADSTFIGQSVYGYCSENPDDPLFLVVDLLFDQLKATRKQAPPAPGAEPEPGLPGVR